jgi:hypothetical protein
MRDINKIHKHIRVFRGEFHEVILSQESQEILQSWFNADENNHIHVVVRNRERIENEYISDYEVDFFKISADKKRWAIKVLSYKSVTNSNVDEAVYLAYINMLAGIIV